MRKEVTNHLGFNDGFLVFFGAPGSPATAVWKCF